MGNEKIRILVVDDEWASLQPTFLNRYGMYEFCGLQDFDAEKAIDFLESDPAAKVLLLDVYRGRDRNAGIELYEGLRGSQRWKDLRGDDKRQAVQVVFFTQQDRRKDHAKVAQHKGLDVSGYVTKDDFYKNEGQFTNILQMAVSDAERYRRFPSLCDEIRSQCGLVYSPNTRSMTEVWEKILFAGKCWEPVLIQGETGTGKELVAQAIFTVLQQEALKAKSASRTPSKIIGAHTIKTCNIGGIPTEGNLQYVELFGATPESASGITKYRRGIFEAADKGTVFLDEIGDAAPIVQVTLLRVLQTGEFSPLGAFAEDKAVKVSFRLITASHVDLPQKVREGGFRADLYYRLNTIQIKLPPLRERKDDIPVLVYTFLDALNEEYGRGITISPNKEDALFERLRGYDWPGNVRQLQMAIRASYVMSLGDEFVLSDDIEQMLDGGGPAPPLPTEQILDALPSSPKSLPDIAKEYGLRTATEVAKLFVSRNGRHPTAAESVQFFSSTRDAVRKWMQDHEVGSPRGRARGKRAG